MIQIGIAQLLAGVLMILSGSQLLIQNPILAAINLVFGAYLLWTSIQKQDPPAFSG